MSTKSLKIKKHQDLAKLIEGKRILHLNSLGKDSVTCLEWLNYFAKPQEIVSINYEFLTKHPKDLGYIQYLKYRYPKTKFISAPNPHELTNIVSGMFQNPFEMLYNINKFDHYDFSMEVYSEEIMKKYDLDYICVGQSKYESFSRAVNFHKFGLVRGKYISPLGMMKKKEIINIIKQRKIKLHPLYKYSSSTFDLPLWYKMRSACIVDRTYYEILQKYFPLLVLDRYRWEVLLGKKRRG